ncbi:MAG: penicillin-binding protein 2 [Patescibacteria group bacterium]|nr:penicillin-binding protein 2 [Patescibacteria group bacterium]
MNSDQRLRSRLIFGLFIMGAAVLAVSLYWTQIVQGSQYQAKADQQYDKPNAAQFDRGTIYFESRDGTRVAAATVGSGYLVFINPSQLADPAEAYSALSQFISVDRASFMAKATKPNDHYEVVADRIATDAAQSIRGLQIAGLNVAPETWRSYPGGTLAAHVLGLTGEDGSSTNIIGRYGLERSYEDVLGRASAGSSANVFAQLFGGIGAALGGASSQSGDIVTTIDPTAQKYLEQTLSQTESVWHSDEIGGIVMDPTTGEIVAMSSLPSFDPNDTSSIKDVSVFSDPLVEHVYEMGSIVKPLTMAMALDSGAEKPDSLYDDTGTMVLNGMKIANYDGRARGIIPMQQILSQSLNIGAATIALKTEKDIGTGTMFKYFSDYGLGEKSGIDEPSEASGLISNIKPGPNLRDINIATASFGQGIAISPIEMVRALSVIANGGYLVTPHVVDEIDHTDGTVQRILPQKEGPVISKTAAEDVTLMLIKVVDDTMAKVHKDMHWQHYSIAAKTGTAQIPDHVHGGYYPNRYLHSFFGFFPAYNPRFIVFLYQVYPKGAEYASETLTDPFSQLAKFLINYYNIAPDR